MAKKNGNNNGNDTEIYNDIIENGNGSSKRIKHITLKNITLTPHQSDFKQKIQNHAITFCTGVAGTSKTFTACYTALDLYNKGLCKRIIITKPTEESGTKLGMLPGTVEDKIDPYLSSYYETFKKLTNELTFKSLLTNKIIEFKPITYMRGATFDNALMIADEAQNYDARELMLFITRMGIDSKIIILGDISQHDIRMENMGLMNTIDMLRDLNEIGVHEFHNEDIVRNKLLVEITTRYERFKYDDKLGKMKKN
jgi:phosphate starvation-inducible PhoH-like protein